MKKSLIMFATIIFFGCTAANAQDIFDKIDRTANKIDRANNTADRSKSTGDKVIGLFSKKKKSGAAADENKTLISFTGATLSGLKGINEKIENSKGVSATKMKFSSSTSSITVQHTGDTDALLKVLQKSVPGVFVEKNIAGLDDGEITVKIK